MMQRYLLLLICNLIFISLSYSQSLSILPQEKYDDFHQEVVSIDYTQIRNILAGNKQKSIPFTAFGTTQDLLITPTQVMSPELAQQYPSISTYRAVTADGSFRGRLTIDNYGLSGILYSPQGAISIHPTTYSQNQEHSIRLGSDPIESAKIPACGTIHSNDVDYNDTDYKTNETENGSTKRTYSIAIGTTYEFYTRTGASTESTTAAVVAIINALEEIFETDLAVNFELLPPLIYTTADDPFTPPEDGGDARPDQANEVIFSNFDFDSFDIGHVINGFSPSWPQGGVAYLRALCDGTNPNNSDKAGGWSGGYERLDFDFINTLAHEVGHQFSARHTFNGNGGGCDQSNLSSATAFEIGSGSTIMSYNGICGLGKNTDRANSHYFHSNSLIESVRHMQNSRSRCQTLIEEETANTPPITNADIANVDGIVIPTGTPFMIVGNAEDDKNPFDLRYTWEQYDAGGGEDHGLVGSAAANSPSAPIFESIDPNKSPIRYFPTVGATVNQTPNNFEVLPQVSRNINFKLVTRDNDPNGGGIGIDALEVEVAESGPFSWTELSTREITPGAEIKLSWETNNSEDLCNNLALYVSYDNGKTFDSKIAGRIAYAAESASVKIPQNIKSSFATFLMLACDDVEAIRFYDLWRMPVSIISECESKSSFLCLEKDSLFLGLGSLELQTNIPAIVNDDLINSDETDCKIQDTSDNETRYTFVAVDKSTDLITSFSDLADFSGLSIGEYDIWGISYKADGDTPPANINPSQWVGNTLNSISNEDNCLIVSDNSLYISVSNQCSITNVSLGTTVCNGDTYDQELKIEYNNPPSDGFLVVNGFESTFNPTVQSVTITLSTLDEASDLIIFFSEDPECKLMLTDFLTPPADCCSIDISLGEDIEACVGDNIRLTAGLADNQYTWFFDNEEIIQNTDGFILPTESGEYIVIVDENGCIGKDTIELIFQQPSIDIGSDISLCDGQLFTIDYLTDASEVSWFLNDELIITQASDVPFSISTAGVLIAEVVDEDGCTNSATINIINGDGPILILQDAIDICEGQDIELIANDAESFMYNWTYNDQQLDMNTNSINVSQAGTYGVTVTDNQGCSSIAQTVLSVTPNPIITNLPESLSICQGESVDVTANIDQDVKFKWTRNGQDLEINAETIEISEAGTYTLSVINSNECQASATFEVSINDLPVPSLPADFSKCGDDPVNIFVGDQFESYAWYLDGVLIDNETTSSIMAGSAGFYEVEVTDNNGCSNRIGVNVTIIGNQPPSIIGDPFFCIGTETNLSVEAEGDIVWTNEDGEIISEETSVTITTVGTYTVLVTTPDGCDITNMIAVEERDGVSIDLPETMDICGQSSYTIEVVNSEDNMYSWLFDDIEIEGQENAALEVEESGTYIVNIVSPEGCLSSDTIAITFTDAPQVSLGRDIILCEGAETTLNINTTSSDIEWYLGDSLIEDENGTMLTVSTAGEYSVSVSIGEDCSATDTVLVTIVPLPQIDLGADINLCDSESTILDAGADFEQYTWSLDGDVQTNFNNVASIEVKEAGVYSVTVTDSNGCTAVDMIEVIAASFPRINIDAEATTICGSNPITVTATHNGDSFSWQLDGSDISGDLILSVQDPGTYTFISTFEGGCSSTSEIVIVQVDQPNADLGPDIEYCGDDGVTLSTNAEAESYSWFVGDQEITSAAGQTSLTITESGTYGILLSNGPNCQSGDKVEVTFLEEPTVSLISSSPIICSGELITLTASSSSDTYQWFLDGAPLDISELTTIVSTAGVYSIQASNGETCTSTAEITLTENNETLDLGDDIIACAGQDIAIVSEVGGTWTFNDEVITNAEGLETLRIFESGTYTLTVGSDTPCIISDTIEVTFNPLPTIELQASSLTICGDGSIELMATHDGGSFAWNKDGEEINNEDLVITVTESGLYLFESVSDQGCSISQDLLISQFDVPSVDLGSDIISCEGEEIILDAGIQGTWSMDGTPLSEFDNQSSITVSQSGVYTFITGRNSDCVITEDVVVTINANPTAEINAPITEICGNTSIDITGSHSGNTFQWLLDDNVLDATDLILTVDQAGTYTLQTTSDAGCIFTDEITITQIDLPSIDLGSDINTCEGQNVILDAGAPGNWTLDGSPLTEFNNQASIEITQSGVYTFILNERSDCDITDEIVATFNPTPTVVVDAPITQICGDGSVQLSATHTGESFEWLKDNVAITTINLEIDATEAGTYTFTSTNDTGCNTSTEIIITQRDLPTIDLGNDIVACSNQDIVITSGRAGSWNINGNILTEAEGQSSITPTESGTYTFTYVNNDCTVSDQIIVTINEAPEIQLNVSSATICGGMPVDIQASHTGDSFQWFLDGSLISNTSLGFSTTEAGTYTFTSTISDCFESKDITIAPSEIASIDLGVDITACEGDNVVLSASLGGNWLQDGNPLSQFDGSENIVVSTAGTYVLIVGANTECVLTDTIMVSYNPSPEIELLPTGNTICGDIPIEITAVHTGDTFQWFKDGAPIENANDLTLIATSGGTYTFESAITFGCSGSKEITLGESEGGVVDLGLDINACEGENVIINGGLSGIWTLDGNPLPQFDNQSIIDIDQAGTYILTIGEGTECVASDDVMVTFNEDPTITVTSTNTTICGNSPLTISAAHTGNTFAWFTNDNLISDNDLSIDVNDAGIYTFESTSSFGCTHEENIVVAKVESTPINLGIDIIACRDDVVTIDAGQVANWFVNGNPLDAFDGLTSINVSAAGTYSATTLDQNQCASSDEIIVSFAALPSTTISASNTTICNDNEIDISATHTGNSFQWLLNGEALSQGLSFSTTRGGTYIFESTNSDGCSSKDTLIIEQIDIQAFDLGIDINVCEGENVILSAGVAGNWFLDGNAIPEFDNLDIISVSEAGTYTLTAGAGTDCAISDEVTVTYNPIPTVVLESTSATLCGSDVIITAVHTGDSFQWFLDGQIIDNPSLTLNATNPGTYTFESNTSFGCSLQSEVTIALGESASVELGEDIIACIGENVTIDAGLGGTWTLDGTPLPQFDGQQSIDVNTAGTYTVTIDANTECSISDNISISFESRPTVSIQAPGNIICDGESIDLTASHDGIEFSWLLNGEVINTNDLTLTISEIGTYSFTSTSQAGCITQENILIQQGAETEVTLGEDISICSGEEVTLVSNIGGSWSLEGTPLPEFDGQQSIVVDAAGTYTLTADATSTCASTDDIIVSINSAPSISLEASNTILCSESSVSITASHDGSTFQWFRDGIAIEADLQIDITESGVYSFESTSQFGCSSTQDITITSSEAETVTLGEDISTCSGQEIIIQSNIGGTWSLDGNPLPEYDGQQSIVVNVPGTYTVTAGAGSACASTDDIIVSINSAPSITLEAPNTILCSESSINIIASHDGSTFQWFRDGIAIEADLQNDITESGVYSFESTSQFGCTSTQDITITSSEVETVSLGEDISTCSGQEVIIQSNIGGAWSLDGNPLPEFDGLDRIAITTPGIYSITVGQGTECSSTDEIIIIYNDTPSVELNPSTLNICESEVTITAIHSGTSFQWFKDGEAIDNDNTILTTDEAGTYAFESSTLFGCTALVEVTLTKSQTTTIELGEDITTCEGELVVLSAGVSGSWALDGDPLIDLEGEESITITTSGVYSLTVGTDDECASTDEIVVNFTPAPDIQFTTTSTVICGTVGPTLSVTGFADGSTVQWFKDGVQFDNTETTFNPTEAGTYEVEVVNEANCRITQEITIEQNESFELDLGQDIIACEGGFITIGTSQADESAVWLLNGDEIVEFAGSPFISVEESGVYTLVIGTGSACTYRDDVNVTINPQPVLDTDISEVSSCSNEVIITINTDAQVFRWFDEDELTSITGNMYTANAGSNITVEVESTEGCIAEQFFTIEEAISTLEVSLGEDQEICGEAAITLDAGTGGDTYEWMLNGQSLEDADGQSLEINSGGIYSVIVSTDEGCMESDEVTISYFNSGLIDIGSDQVICNGANTTIDAEYEGDNFEWRLDGEVINTESKSIEVEVGGEYTFVAISQNECEASVTVTITLTDIPALDLGEDITTCEGELVTLSAGAGGSWSLDGTSLTEFQGQESIIITTPGVYALSIGGNSECAASDEVVVNFISAPDIEFTTTSTIICGDVSPTLTVTGLAEGSTILWLQDGVQFENTETTFTPTEAGSYAIEVANEANCRVTQEIIIEQNESFELDLGEDIIACEGGFVTIGTSQADESAVWLLDGNEIVEFSGSPFISVEQSGVYSLVIGTASACSFRDDVNVTINPQPVLDTDITEVNSCSNEVTITINTDAVIFRWFEDDELTNVSGNIYTANAGSNITVEVESTEGCVSEQFFAIEEGVQSLDVDLGDDQEICGDEPLTLNAGEGWDTYEWSKDGEVIEEETQQTLVVTSSGTYGVVVTTEEGCMETDDVIIQFFNTELINLGEDQFLCTGDATIILADYNGDNFEWRYNGEVINTENKSIEIEEGGEYTFTAISENDCEASDAITITTVENPIIDLGEDISTCLGTPISLDPQIDDASYSWFLNGEQILDDRILEVRSSGIYRIDVITDEGCFGTDEIKIEFQESVVFDLGEEQVRCEGEEYTISVDTEDELIWSKDGDVIDGETGNSITVFDSGVYSASASGDTECDAFGSTTVTFLELPEIDLGNAVDICDGESVTLSAPEGEGFRYAWTKDGEAILEDGPRIEVTETGLYSVTIITLEGCNTSGETRVNESIPPTLELLADSESFCISELITLSASSNATSFTWFKDGDMLDDNDPTLQITEAGTYTVIASNEGGCTTEASIQFDEVVRPTVDLGEDMTICPDESITLDAGMHTLYNWSTGEDSQTIEINSPNLFELTSESISVEITNEEGCTATDEITITYRPLLTASIESNQNNVCNGEEITLTATGGTQYMWTDTTGMVTDPTGESITVAPTTTTEYTVEVTDECTNNFDIAVIVIDVPEGENISITLDTCIVFGQQIQLNVVGGVSVMWDSHPSFLTSRQINNPTVEPTETTIYSVEIIDVNGCRFRRDVEICIVDDPLDIFKAITIFTPNGDGKNDVLEFKGLEAFPDNEITVFNRWGNVVFESIGYQVDGTFWDGTRNGEPLPSDTYYYVLKFGNSIVKNSLTILRN